MDAAMVTAHERLPRGTGADYIPASVQYQSEEVNQNNKPEKFIPLFYGTDGATVKNQQGDIWITLKKEKTWKKYDGNNDDPFILGDLRGKEARLTAIDMYRENNNR